ncbi:MAG: PAS domain S-box protein [Euryarchaeota archaeon]|nr:PAS domain S-box protein [Euryarchaeota archaeon]
MNETTEKWRTLIEEMPIGVMLIDCNRKIRDINKSATDMVGRAKEGILGRVCHEFVCPMAQNDCPVYDHEKTLDRAEAVLLSKDRGEVAIEKTVTKIVMGGETMLVEMFSDIIERKVAEESLREGEERFRMMFENMSNVVAVYESVDVGNDFIFKGLNRAGEKIDGMKCEDIIGKSVLDVFPGVVEFGLFDVFQRVWQTGEPEHHSISFYKGEKIAGWRENYVYKLPSGEIVAIYDDVTEQKQMEESLAESEEKYRTFIERASEGYWGLDSLHKTSAVNPALCDMLGYTMEGMLGRSPHDFVDEENLKIFEYQMGRIGSTLHRSYEIVLKKKSGEDIPAWFNATTIVDDAGEFKGAYSLVTDISKRKAAEDALREGEERFRAIFETAQDSIFIMDRPLRYIRGVPRTFHTIKVPIRDSSGEIAGLCGIARDITRQKELEQKLHDSFDKLMNSYKELAIPVIQVHDGVLAIPIMGALDDLRIKRFTGTMLAKITDTKAVVVILDLTAVRSIDSDVANRLLETVAAARLLGADCILTGIGPEVAAATVRLGLDEIDLVTRGSLQEGLVYAMQRVGGDGRRTGGLRR